MMCWRWRMLVLLFLMAALAFDCSIPCLASAATELMPRSLEKSKTDGIVLPRLKMYQVEHAKSRCSSVGEKKQIPCAKNHNPIYMLDYQFPIHNTAPPSGTPPAKPKTR